MDTAVAVLRDLVADLPDEAEEHALAALAALTDPDVARAALGEQGVQERLAAATPHLVPMPGNVHDGRVDVTDCPDCTRGTYSVGGVLVCIQLPARVGRMDGKPGDIVACGKER